MNTTLFGQTRKSYSPPPRQLKDERHCTESPTTLQHHSPKWFDGKRCKYCGVE